MVSSNFSCIPQHSENFRLKM